MSVRMFGPKKADHPSVGMPCARCGVKFVAGDRTALVGDEPGSPEDADKKRRGLAYNAIASEIHWDCCTPED